MALTGSWARGEATDSSDLDLLFLTDQAADYRRSRKWMRDIRFERTTTTDYGVVWSRHLHLVPSAEIELTFANSFWAALDPLDAGTRGVIQGGFEPIFDKDGILPPSCAPLGQFGCPD